MATRTQEVEAKGGQSRHRSLGLSDDQALRIYEVMRLARAIDERMWLINRQGRAPFVISCQGQEGAQVSTAAALRPGHDWVAPYYRDAGVILWFGMTARDQMLSFFARREDPNSGGRQMPGHFGSKRLHIVTGGSPVGTQLLHAAGVALASKQRKEDAVTAAYFGEGAASQGDCHEAMNFAGIHKLAVIFVCENNGYAISVPQNRQMAIANVADRAAGYGFPGEVVDGNDVLACYEVMRKAVDRARRGEGPTLIEAKTYRFTAHSSDDDDKRYRQAEEVAIWRQKDPIQRYARYLKEAGTLTDAAEAEITQRVDEQVDDATEYAEQAPDPTPADLTTFVYKQEPRILMATRTVIEAIREGMDEEMARDSSVFLIGEDVGKRGGVFLASDGLFKKYGEDRVIDSPLAESTIVGLAIGAAVNGMRPIAEIQFADFIAPAMNQIIEEAARFCYRTAGDFNLPMVIRAPWGGGVHGALYHSQSIEATFGHIPGLKVVVPGTPADAKGLLKAAVRDPDPVLFLEHKRTYRLVRGEVPDGDGVVPIGKAEVKREGKDISLIAYGLMLTYCLEVAERLAAEGVSAEVLDLRSIKPIDQAAIVATAKKTGKVLVVHEDNRFAGIAAEVMALIMENAFDSLDAPVMRLTGPDVPAMPFNHVLEDAFMPNPEKILAKARELAAY